jgi:hypothetical protein
MRRLIATCARSLTIFALVLWPCLWSLGTAHAAPWRTYHNVTFGYTLSYPPDWRHFTAAGTNIAIETADTGAVFDGVAEANLNTPTAGDLGAVVDSVLHSAGVASTATIRHTTRVLRGVPFIQGSATVQRANGQTIQFTGLAAYHARIAYVFATALVTAVSGVPRPAAPAQGRALARIVNSIAVTGPA